MYIFSDEEVLFNDDIYRDPETIILRNYNAGDFEINYTGSKNIFWLIRDHGPNERLTDAIKVEVKETQIPPLQQNATTSPLRLQKDIPSAHILILSLKTPM